MRKSRKFKGAFIHNGLHYFFNEAILADRNGVEKVQVSYVFYDGKWRQDEDFMNKETFMELTKKIDKDWVSDIYKPEKNYYRGE